MKIVFAGALLAFTALGVCAQGTVRFENNIPGVLVTHIYEVNLRAPVQLEGNGPDDFPSGDRDWSEWTPAAGSGFSAQLLGAVGASVDYSFLRPVSAITTFQTGENAGFLVPSIATLAGIPADAPVATIMLVAWDNQEGTVNTWDQALYGSRSYYGGIGPFNVYDIGGEVNPPPILEGLRSFSMLQQIVIDVPEPSNLTLVGLGALAALAFRRRSGRPAARI